MRVACSTKAKVSCISSPVTSQIMMILSEPGKPNDAWIVNSGANICIANDKSWFSDFRPLTYQIGTADTLSNSNGLKVEGSGNVDL